MFAPLASISASQLSQRDTTHQPFSGYHGQVTNVELDHYGQCVLTGAVVTQYRHFPSHNLTDLCQGWIQFLHHYTDHHVSFRNDPCVKHTQQTPQA